jgi:hypothetical protein
MHTIEHVAASTHPVVIVDALLRLYELFLLLQGPQQPIRANAAVTVALLLRTPIVLQEAIAAAVSPGLISTSHS